MPTGVPANQLNDDELRALFALSLDALINNKIPPLVRHNDLKSANMKLFNTLYAPKKKPGRKPKKGSEKVKAE